LEGETSPLPSLLRIDDAAERLPRSPTRPRWQNRQRLLSVAIRADFHNQSAAEIVEEDGEADLLGDRRRGVHKEIQRSREFLAALGALPWAAFDRGAIGRRDHWCSSSQMADALADWRHDSANLSWREPRERGPVTDPARDAANAILLAPWKRPDERMVALATGRLSVAARSFSGTCDEWLEGLIGYPHQTLECRRDLVERADHDGSGTALRDIWSKARFRRIGEPLDVSAQ
jgi:hypothetical protein